MPTLCTDHANPKDIETLKRAFDIAVPVAQAFGLRLSTMEHKRRPSAGGALGLCYPLESRISVCVRYRDAKAYGGKWWGEPLSWNRVLTTTLHEVAHLPSVRTGLSLRDGLTHRQLQKRMHVWCIENGLCTAEELQGKLAYSSRDREGAY